MVGTPIPYGSTFLVIESEDVYKYIPSGDTWEPIMGKPRRISYDTAMLVDLDTFPDC